MTIDCDHCSRESSDGRTPHTYYITRLHVILFESRLSQRYSGLAKFSAFIVIQTCANKSNLGYSNFAFTVKHYTTTLPPYLNHHRIAKTCLHMLKPLVTRLWTHLYMHVSSEWCDACKLWGAHYVYYVRERVRVHPWRIPLTETYFLSIFLWVLCVRTRSVDIGTNNVNCKYNIKNNLRF